MKITAGMDRIGRSAFVAAAARTPRSATGTDQTLTKDEADDTNTNETSPPNS